MEKNSANFENYKLPYRMKEIIDLISNKYWSYSILVVIISLIAISILGYFVFVRFERKISSLYPRKRHQLDTSAFKKVRQEFFRQDKQIEASKMVINILIDSRNHTRRLSEEMKNIEYLYNEFKQIKTSDFEILEDLKSSIENIPNNLEALIISKREYLNAQFLELTQDLKQVLSECNTIIDSIFANKPNEIEKNFFTACTKNIDSNCLIIKELYDKLIKNFQENFPKTL
jgi:hypothetical protein